ncbi:MAG TPA: tetratricopeptide repeat-containing glycosyltransferase family protein [Burkholderiales bacterium]|nr:tetratricopeptide repeat-containing glycosyltransferase family protein [Burkholderiales bacterium]
MLLKTLARDLVALPLRAWRARRAAALQNVALRQCDRGDREAALATLKRAASLDPKSASVRAFMGVVLLQLRSLDAALDHLRIAHDTDPQNGDILKLLVETLLQSGRYQKALTICEAALRRDRAFYEAWTCLGLVYRRTHRSAEALECYERAVALNARDVDSMANRAIALSDLGRLDEALEALEAVLAVSPDHVLARFHRGLARLSQGDYAQGWPDYELRLASSDKPEIKALAPRWEGAPLEGRSILVRGEQGLGDQIMFASCLPELITNAASCTIECERKLVALFGRSFPEARVHAIGETPADARHDFEVPLGSLPLHCRRTAQDFPRHPGYLKPDPARVREWRGKLHALGPGLKIGISWRGGTALTRVALRSIPLEGWERLFALAGVRFVSLQYTDAAAAEVAALERSGGPSIVHWPEAIDDYDETAALVAALDLTISVCTSVVHLAGAVGRPVWVLAPQAAEWRYGTRGEALPWYPSARVFRQEHPDDWDSVLRRVASELHALQQYSFGGAGAVRH